MTVCPGTCVRASRNFELGKLSVRVDPKSANATGLTVSARGLFHRDLNSAPICYICGVRQSVQKRVLTHTLLLLALVGVSGCLPSDRLESASEAEVSHDKYPEFEGFSDTQAAILTGSGGSADWLGEATMAPGIDSTADRFSSGQDSLGSGTGSEGEGGQDSQGDESSDASGDSSDESGGESTSDKGTGVETWTSTEPVEP